MKKIAMIVLTALATASAATASNPLMEVAKPSSSNVMLRASGSETDSIANAIVTRADMEVSFANDEVNPWTISGDAVTNGNCGKRYSTSLLTMTFNATSKAQLTFEWESENYSNHSLQVYIDGVYQGSTTNTSYTTARFYLNPGEHIVLFRDSIGNSTTTNNWSYIKNVIIKDISPLESAVLTDTSMPLTFANDETWPWTIEEGYIQNSNYGTKFSSSRFSTTFTIDKTSKLSYEVAIPKYGTYYSNNSSISYHTLYIDINGKRWDYWQGETGWTQDRIVLEPGTYSVLWLDTIRNTTNDYYAQLRNISLTSNWVDVELASVGTLGVEVLYKVDVLNDVEMLKIVGPLNSTDWTTIKQMKNLSAIDLSEATFESLPNSAFNGMTWLGSVILPEGLKSIGEYAFKGTRLININIPSTVTLIERSAFEGVSQLRKVTFTNDSELQTIGTYAFKNCSKLEEITLPSQVETIKFAAFDQCSSLLKIEMPNTVTFVGAYAFYGCI